MTLFQECFAVDVIKVEKRSITLPYFNLKQKLIEDNTYMIRSDTTMELSK